MDKQVLDAANEWAEANGLDPHAIGKTIAKMEASDFLTFADAAFEQDGDTMGRLINKTQSRLGEGVEIETLPELLDFINETFGAVANAASQFNKSNIRNAASQFGSNEPTTTAEPQQPQQPSTPQDLTKIGNDLADMEAGSEVGIKSQTGDIEMTQLQGVDINQQNPQDTQVVVSDETDPNAMNVMDIEDIEMLDMEDPEVQRMMKLAGM